MEVESEVGMLVYIAVNKMAVQSRTLMKTSKLYVYQNHCILLCFLNSKHDNENKQNTVS